MFHVKQSGAPPPPCPSPLKGEGNGGAVLKTSPSRGEVGAVPAPGGGAIRIPDRFGGRDDLLWRSLADAELREDHVEEIFHIHLADEPLQRPGREPQVFAA